MLEMTIPVSQKVTATQGGAICNKVFPARYCLLSARS